MKNKSKAAQDLGINYRLGMPSNEHWEVLYKPARGHDDDPKGAFLPMPGKDRAQPHQKINECDH